MSTWQAGSGNNVHRRVEETTSTWDAPGMCDFEFPVLTSSSWFKEAKTKLNKVNDFLKMRKKVEIESLRELITNKLEQTGNGVRLKISLAIPTCTTLSVFTFFYFWILLFVFNSILNIHQLKFSFVDAV